MRVHSISVTNFRSFKVLEEITFGPLTTIVGKNDVGKSNILRALEIFFAAKPNIVDSDVHVNCSEDVTIEVAFTDLPEEVELESGVKTTLGEEHLLDATGTIRVRKVFPRNNLSKPSIHLIVEDYKDDDFSFLSKLKEPELNKRCQALGVDAQKSGRGITNKSKRLAIRQTAQERSITFDTREIALSSKDDLWQSIQKLFPEFILFPVDTKLGVSETTFQSQFRPIVKEAASDESVGKAREDFTSAISERLQAEVSLLHNQLKRYTDAFVNLHAVPDFAWDKAVSFDILGEDKQGIEQSLERRGSGLRRLLMVAFFQYLANKKKPDSNYIFTVEEPENCLHPGLQRELINSFVELTLRGFQVILTSHSPVFAGASPIEHLALVTRESGVASAIQYPVLRLDDVAAELGVEPADQVTGYHACIFVEGPGDILFFNTIATKLKEAGVIKNSFKDKKIGFVMCGGECLKHWISRQAMKRLNRRFAVIVDSDKKSREANIPQKKMNWKKSVEEDKGLFFILNKREIENYLHPDAIRRHGITVRTYDDYCDMKSLFGKNVIKAVQKMTADEILERDKYKKNGSELHELKEIIEELTAMV